MAAEATANDEKKPSDAGTDEAAEKAAKERAEATSRASLFELQKVSGEVLRLSQRLDHTAVEDELAYLRERIAALAEHGRAIYETAGAGGGSRFVGKDQTEADLYFNKIDVTASSIARA